MARMRTAFELPVKTAVQWYPGHMAKGLQVMRTRIRSCNCVLEVHDARIPYSGRNRAFFELIANKPHLLILNKKDLAETQGREVCLYFCSSRQQGTVPFDVRYHP
jgi:ribosome biogenesis GTPase A